MYKVINNRAKFLPYDICRIKGTQEYIMITEVNLNTGQTEDEHQWSWAAEPITPGNTKCAWFTMDELEFVKNVFDIIAKQSMHPFGNKAFKFSVSESKRRK